MKKISIIKYIIPALFLFVSCDDFLEESSQDLIKPTTVSNFQELLVGEGYFHSLMDYGWFIELMTDNVEFYENPLTDVNLLPTEIESGEDCYLWQNNIEDKLGPDKLYKHIYGNILAANTCLESVDGAEGTEEEKNILYGQSSFMRAYGYFLLANLYAQAYNESDESDLCVPLFLEAKPSLEKFKRNTIKKVWDQIKLDADNAVKSLEKVNRVISVYEVNYSTALLFAARVALFMEEYDNVIKYGEEFLKINPALYDISDGLVDEKTGFLDVVTNPEVVFNFGTDYEYRFIYETTGLCQFTFRVYNTNEQSLMTHYSSDDQRKYAFFEQPEISLWLPYFNKETWLPKKYDKYDKTGLRQTFRSAEVYLMMAEANARKVEPNNDKAISYLNTLRTNRIENYVALNGSDFSTQEELVEFIWDERRRELCFEEFHRWWDLRRIGQPAIQHNWKGGKIYELKEKDPAYILNFPQSERDFNDDLVINPRPHREAIN